MPTQSETLRSGPQGPSASPSTEEHKRHAPRSVASFVAISSDSRTEADDESGALIRALLEEAGHAVAGYALIRNEPAALREVLERRAVEARAQAVILSGGTGLSRRDTAVEVLEGMLEKRLPGFGELFRMLSFQEIGPSAMMSRALAGSFRGMAIFALPGSPAAARLALTRLILPELGHAVRELSR